MNYKKAQNITISLIIYTILLSVLCVNSQMHVTSYFLSANAEDTSSYDTIDYPCPDDDSVLEKGSKSEEICWLQTALNMIIGANLEVDGSFGEKTKSAVIEFQSQYGLTADGTVGGQTIKKIKEILSSDTEDSTDNKILPEEKENQQLGKKEYKFTEYWKYYYKYSKKLFFHFSELKNEIISKSSFSDVVVSLGIFEAVLLFICFITVTFKCYTAIYNDGSEELWVLPIFHLNGGCMPTVVFFIVNLIFLILSPILADIGFLYEYFSLSIRDCVLKAIFFFILKLVVSLFIYFILGLLLNVPLKICETIIQILALLFFLVDIILINISPIIMYLSII